MENLNLYLSQDRLAIFECIMRSIPLQHSIVKEGIVIPRVCVTYINKRGMSAIGMQQALGRVARPPFPHYET